MGVLMMFWASSLLKILLISSLLHLKFWINWLTLFMSQFWGSQVETFPVKLLLTHLSSQMSIVHPSPTLLLMPWRINGLVLIVLFQYHDAVLHTLVSSREFLVKYLFFSILLTSRLGLVINLHNCLASRAVLWWYRSLNPSPLPLWPEWVFASS